MSVNVQTWTEETDDTAILLNDSTGGFNFDNTVRNAQLAKEATAKKVILPKFVKTGTTIAGVMFKDGVVLGADTRSTAGPIVANKNCEKIHYMAPNIYCCGAGTAADCDQVTAMMSSQLTLHRRNTGEESLVVCALTRLKRYLFRYQGYVSAALVLGGVDRTGPHLHTVWPHGSISTLPYVTMGSGSLAAMAVFEESFKKDMTKEEAMKLVQEGILSGINNDMGSGSNIDLVVITRSGTQMLRNYFKTKIPQEKLYKIAFQKGTTPLIGSAKASNFIKREATVNVRISEEDSKEEKKMDID